MTIDARAIVSALLFLAASCSSEDRENPTLCDLSVASDAVVQCQFTAVGQQATAQQAGLPAPSTSIPLMLAAPYTADMQTPMIQVTLNVSNPLKGSLTGAVNAWAWSPEGASTAYLAPYADGTPANGYCFLMQSGNQWVLESSGYFLQDEKAPTVLRNLTVYSSGISQQALLNGVAAAPTSINSAVSCPVSGPAVPAPLGLPPPGAPAGTGT